MKYIKIFFGVILLRLGFEGIKQGDYILGLFVFFVGAYSLYKGIVHTKVTKKTNQEPRPANTSTQPIQKPKKQKSTPKDLKDFSIIDFETTGLSTYSDEIIEIGAIKVRNLDIIDYYSTLCSPLKGIKNSSIHGITDEDVKLYKSAKAYMQEFMTFIGDDTIFVYNAPFDISFLNSYLDADVPNKIVDILQLAKSKDSRQSYRLVDVRKDLGITTEEHRAIGDCEATLEYYKYLLATYNIKKLSYFHQFSDSSLARAAREESFVRHSIENFEFDETKVDKDNYFYHKKVCFTGTLNHISKSEASLKVLKSGGEIQKNVTLKTDILVVGEYDHITGKEKKALEYNERPSINIELMNENTFLRKIEDLNI